MNIRHHSRRLVVALVVPFAMLAACSGSEGVPDDQQLQPASKTTGWKSSNLDLLSVATPSEWTMASAASPKKGMTLTIWSTPPVDGQSAAGMEVREITDPDHEAGTAAEGLAVNAMATMKGDKPNAKQIVWPNATDAWMFTSDITTGLDASKKQEYVSTMFVADLADGRQVQVLIFTVKGPEDDLGTRVLSTIKLAEAK